MKTDFSYAYEVKTELSESALKLKTMREHAGFSRERLAALIGRKPTSYATYETTFKKLHQPMDLVRAVLPHFLGKGQPPITREEILDLAGVTELEDVTDAETTLTVRALPVRSLSPVPGDPIYDLGEAGLLKIWRRLDERGQASFYGRLAAEEAAARRKAV